MVWLHNPRDIRTLLSKEGSMPILPSMNTFIELRQEEDYKNIFQESTGLISQVHEYNRCNMIDQYCMTLLGGDLVLCTGTWYKKFGTLT